MQLIVVLFVILFASTYASEGLFDESVKKLDETTPINNMIADCSGCMYANVCYGYGSIINMPPSQQMICCGNYWKRYCMLIDACLHC